jgi:diguanylate cyclase (GGDEF)-like protein/PAS domain S-box-containing protein
MRKEARLSGKDFPLLPMRQSTINICAAALLVLALSLLVIGNLRLRASMAEENAAAAAEKETHLLADSMKDASDFLSDQVKAFTVTRARSHLNAFWREVEATRRRDKAIAALVALDLPAGEKLLLESAKAESDRLILTETRAMRLVADATGLPEGELPLALSALELGDEDRRLEPEGKLKLAQDLVFGPAYEARKRVIMGYIADFNTASRVRTEGETRAAQGRANRAFLVVMALYVFCIITGTVFMYLYFTQIARPVNGYLRELAAAEPEDGIPALSPCGTRELVALAEAFNQRRYERMESEKALRDSERRMRTHFRMMPLGEMEIDKDDRIIAWNPAAERIFGFSEAEAMGRDVLELIVPEEARDEVRKVIQGLNAGEEIDRHSNRNLRKDGRVITCDWYNTPLFDSEGTWMGWASIVKDITQEKEESEKILYLSRHDPLTGLFNRRHLVEKLEEARLRTRRTGASYSTIMIDIDRFKLFNDIHGHECGDLVLKTVASTLQESLRATDSIGRWGGEEFLILLPETNLEGARELGERIRQRVEAASASYGGTELKVTITVGVSVCRDGEESIDDCIRRADEALLEGKAKGRNRTVTSS